MLDNLKNKLINEMKDISKGGVKAGNIEYISKLAETYKNINKAEKEEKETMMYDERLDGGMDRRYQNDRYSDGRYSNDRYNDGDSYGDERYSGRGPYARRDSRGRYADNGIVPLENRYYDYMDTKRRYRNGGGDKQGMYDGIDMVMKYVVKLIEELYRDCDGEEERRIMDKDLRKVQELQ